MAIVFATRTSDGAPLTISLVRGTRWQDEATLTEETTGVPVDLTGVTSILMRIRRTIQSDTVLLELSTDNGRITVDDEVNGEISFDVLSAITNTFPANNQRKAKYVYDLMIERSAGEWEAGIGGKIVVLPSTTRPLDDA